MYRAFDIAVTFDNALHEFKEFFFKKTGVMWKDRVTLAGTTDKALFQYWPPVGSSILHIPRYPLR